jgi:L-alanine-DL-glutamate epimerase-like enolase superfamily enzyme
MQLRWRRRTWALGAPFRAAWGTLQTRELIELELLAGDGLRGRGEVAPLPPYDGVSLDAAEASLAALAELIADGDAAEREALLDAAWASGAPACAIAGLDLALWDLAGRRAGRSVAALLGAPAGAHVEVNATIAAGDRAGAAAAASAAARAGYTCIKVKVGIGDDAGRLAAVRAATGRQVQLRVDANGAWTQEPEALAALEALAPAGLELAEEPMHGVDALRRLRASAPVPIAMDETAADAGAWAAGATDFVCLKLSRCGGISALLSAARAARAAGSEVYLASNLDGPLGVAGALHAAATLGPLPACGLATLELFDAPSSLPVVAGTIAVPSGPGLGLD